MYGYAASRKSGEAGIKGRIVAIVLTAARSATVGEAMDAAHGGSAIVAFEAWNGIRQPSASR